MSGQIGYRDTITNGLVFYLDAANYKSYVSGSTTWTDISGYNNNGTLINGPTFNSASGGSIVFDGTDDSVTCGTFTNALTSTTIVSYFCWFYLTRTTNEPLIFRTNSSFTSGWNTYVVNGVLRSTLRPSVGNNNNITLGTILANRWYYGGITCNGTTITQYINGASVSSTPVSSININNGDILRIGGYNFGTQITMQGRISNVQIYNRGLSAAEVLQNYNSTKARFGL